jgi:arginase family enzyme
MIVRLFGAALDALDDSERVGLKQAYLRARAEGHLPSGLPEDPYDALAFRVTEGSGGNVELAGKLALPGWLTPRPSPQFEHQVTPERYRAFIRDDRIRDWMNACALYVEEEILPHVPCMIAVDHAMTAGPLRALSSCHGPETLTVVVLDSHLDAVLWELRVPDTEAAAGAGVSGAHNCGSFLAGLLEEGVLLPENLFVVGVSDFPALGTTTPAYERAYLSLVERGVHIYSRDQAATSSFPDELARDLSGNRGTRLYVSLDADAGALACMNAVRFLDTRGLSETCLLGLASRLRNLVDSGRFVLAGLDVAEVDVHMLCLNGTPSEPDRTTEVCVEFLRRLLP